MSNEIARIKEMFVSTQGEGPFVGYRQLFVRFCACNLACKYCDTDFSFENPNYVYSPKELAELISTEFDISNIHSISLTGGEPLLHADFFKEFIPTLPAKYYLETNATLSDKMYDVINLIDIVSADIKLPSATGINGTLEKHNSFFSTVRQNPNIYLFAKMVFDENITEEEILASTNMAKKYDFELVLQPKTNPDNKIIPIEFAENIFSKCLKRHKNTRLIPQVHKFLDIR